MGNKRNVNGSQDSTVNADEGNEIKDSSKNSCRSEASQLVLFLSGWPSEPESSLYAVFSTTGARLGQSDPRSTFCLRQACSKRGFVK